MEFFDNSNTTEMTCFQAQLDPGRKRVLGDAGGGDGGVVETLAKDGLVCWPAACANAREGLQSG